MPAEEAIEKKLIEKFDPKPAYIHHLSDLVDLQPIKDAGFKILVDAMWGNGGGWFTELLSGGKTTVKEIHDQRNPIFPEMERPEPIRPNIDVGLRTTLATNSDILIINDGSSFCLKPRCERKIEISRGDWITCVKTYSLMTSDLEYFHLTNTLDAYENNTRVFTRSWTKKIPRFMV